MINLKNPLNNAAVITTAPGAVGVLATSVSRILPAAISPAQTTQNFAPIFPQTFTPLPATKPPPLPAVNITPPPAVNFNTTPPPAENSEPPPLSEPVSQLDLTGIEDKLSEALTLLRQTAENEKIVSALHAELQTYKNDLRAEFLFPLLRQIIVWVERVYNIHAHYENQSRSDAGNLENLFSTLLAEYKKLGSGLTDLLEEYGITAFAPCAGDSLERKLHKVIATYPTADAALNGKVAFVNSYGFLDTKTNRVFKHAEITTYKLQ